MTMGRRQRIGRSGLTLWSWLPFTLWVMGQPVHESPRED